MFSAAMLSSMLFVESFALLVFRIASLANSCVCSPGWVSVGVAAGADVEGKAAVAAVAGLDAGVFTGGVSFGRARLLQCLLQLSVLFLQPIHRIVPPGVGFACFARRQSALLLLAVVFLNSNSLALP